MKIKNRLFRAFPEKSQRGSFDLEDFTAIKFFHIIKDKALILTSPFQWKNMLFIYFLMF